MNDYSGVYAVIVEFKNQAPMLMETEGKYSSFENAEKRRRGLEARLDVIRALTVKVGKTEGWNGNDLLLDDMKRMQE